MPLKLHERGTFDAVSIAQRVQGVFTGRRGWGHIGNHDRARLVSCEGVPQHLHAGTL